ncbi:MAG: DUF6261 family protein [Chitinophagaceae bacterium]
MKQLFLNVQYNKLRNGEALGFYRNIVDAANTSGAATLQIKSLVDALANANKAVDVAFNGVFASKFTEQLLALDASRDDDFKGIKLAAKSAQLHRDANKVKAGNTIIKAIEKYGNNIENQPHRVQTTILRNIGDYAAITGVFKDALTLLGLDTWLTEMLATNTNFEAKFDERSHDFATNKSKISVSEAIVNARTAYNNLLKGIEARNTLDTTSKYTVLIDVINKTIKDTNTVAKIKATAAVKAAKPKEGTK